MEDASRPSTGSPRQKKRRILQGLDLNKILTPPPPNLSDNDGQVAKRKTLDSERHDHATRQKIRGSRDENEANYDAKFHPMDRIHKGRLKAHKRRFANNQLNVTITLDIDDDDGNVEEHEEAETDCGEVFQSGDDEDSVSSGQEQDLSSGYGDVEEVPCNPVLFSHPAPTGLRQSLRLRKQTFERPTYSQRVHLQDFDILFHRQAAKRKLKEDIKTAKEEARGASKATKTAALSRKGIRSKSGIRPNFGVEPVFSETRSMQSSGDGANPVQGREEPFVPESPPISPVVESNTKPLQPTRKEVNEQMLDGLSKSLSTPASADIHVSDDLANQKVYEQGLRVGSGNGEEPV